MTEKQRYHIIRKASILGILGNSLLGLLKIATGLLSGSIAVVADGIDSITDIATSFITLFTARIVKAPPDKEHPWGHGRAETIATKGLSFIILFSGSQLFLNTMGKLRESRLQSLPGKAALTVTLLSITGKLLLARMKKQAGIQAESSMLLADAKNMGNDVLLSVAVLLGLGGTWLFKNPLADQITGLILSLWIIKGGLDIFMESSVEMMDSLKDPSVYGKVFQAVHEIPQVKNPHRARIRKINTLYDIDLDIEVDGTLTVKEAHDIARQVEKRIREKIPQLFDVMIHIEPAGNVEEHEQFGLNPQDLRENHD